MHEELLLTSNLVGVNALRQYRDNLKPHACTNDDVGLYETLLCLANKGISQTFGGSNRLKHRLERE